ncbi:MAG: PQQ-binding-like beta-propeller repeat protein [Verrucomicrobiota bacterium]|nr:PQQ-binding-like beta-propeller repeat protein [Verrucomicrobiota bacterium]
MNKSLIYPLVILYSISCAFGSNWPAWRGADATGSTEEGNYPSELNLKKNLLWKAPLPDKGCSTPIVWEDSILLTSPINGEDAVLSFSMNGGKNWQTKIGPERKGRHLNGSGSNPSVVTDGKNLFALFKSGNLACLDLDGKIIWKKDLSSYGKDTLYWDFGTSPILTSKHLIVALMRKGNSWLLAFDPKNGEVAWEKERNYETPPECDHSYATPTLIQHDGKEAILVWGAERLSAHSAADGKMHWVSTGFNPKQKKNWVVVGSQVVVGNIAIVPYGRGTHMKGIRMGGKGDITESNLLWSRTDTGCFVPSPAVAHGKVYVLRDRGEVHCLNPKTGKSHWEDAFPRASSSYYASPTVAGSKLYAPREDGVILIADISKGFKFIGEFDMGERVIASPVPVNNQILIRGEKNLLCFGG